jgi:molecular chaperone DnaK
VQGSSNLSKEEIERMNQEAEAHAADDKKRRETVDTRNQADTLISVAEKTLKEAGDKAPEADRTEAQAKLDALKAIKDNDDIEPLKKAIDELSAAIQKVGAAMYQQQPAAGAEDAAGAEGAAGATSEAAAGPAKEGEKPADAEVVE